MCQTPELKNPFPEVINSAIMPYAYSSVIAEDTAKYREIIALSGGSGMNILYRYGGSLYVNMTNRCPNRCTFCVRGLTDGLGTADSLWLEREPTIDGMYREFHKWDMREFDEVVFCGYGEPTERLEELKKLADHIHWKYHKRVRLNTNGLGSLINGRDIVPELAKCLDAISISLNAPNSERYQEVCRTRFGADAYPALIDFIKECRASMEDVTVSVVSGSISQAEEDECFRMAQSLDVKFRSR